MFHLLQIFTVIEINMLVDRLQNDPQDIEIHEKLATIYYKKVPP